LRQFNRLDVKEEAMIEDVSRWSAQRDLAAMEEIGRHLANALEAADPLLDFADGEEFIEQLSALAGRIERMAAEQRGHVAALD
jgi:hypothetical protein